MKQKCSSILKIAVALVLALLMVFGSVSTVLAAVVQPALLGAASSVAGTAANADLAETGADTTRILFVGIPTGWGDPTSTTVRYYNAGDPSNSSASITALKDSSNNTVTSGDGNNYIYYATVTTSKNNWQIERGNNWYGGDQDMSSTSTTNCGYIWWDNGAKASYVSYQVTSTASLAASSTSITTAETSTLTPSLSSYSTFNDIKSTTYSVTTNPGSAGSVTSAGVFSATAAGTYTVTATVTYNAKGFTGITKTATATKSITVTQAATNYTGITAVAKGTTDGTSYSVDLGTIQSSTTVSSSTGLSVTAPPKDGYTFSKWVASGSGTFDSATSASTTFHPAANSEIATAQYKKNYTFSNGTTDTHGTVTIPSGTIKAGDSYSGTVTPADGYKIKSLTVGGNTVTDAAGKTSAYSYSGTTGSSTTGTSTPISVVASFEARTDLNLYIAGRFRVHPSDGATTWTTTYDSNSDWNATSTKIKFSHHSGTVYKVETYATLAELTAQPKNSQDPWFFIYDTSASKSWHFNGSANKELTSSVTEASMNTNTATYNVRFNVTDSHKDDGPVTIYFDYSTKRLWYSIPDLYNVTVAEATGGSVTASPARAEADTEITLTIAPTTGYQLKSITAKDSSNASVTLSGTGDTRTFTMPAKDVTVTPVFEKITWSGLTAVGKYSTTAVDNASYSNDFPAGTAPNVTIAATSATQLDGVAVSAPATDPEGYVFAGWYTAKGSFANAANKDTTFKPNAANAVAIAKYKKIFTITSSVDSNGTGAGTVTTSKTSVEAGGSYTITATPKSGSAIESIKVNNGSGTTTSPRTVSSVSADQTVVVKFASKAHLIGDLATNAWTQPGDALKSNADGTKFTITISEKNAGTYEFKHYVGTGSGGTYNATAIPAASQTLNGIATLDNSGTNENYKLVTTVKSNIILESDGTKFTSITVTPANVPTFNVTLKKVAGSTITSTYMGVDYSTASADAVVPVYQGTEINFTVTADSGKYISALTTTEGTLSPAFTAGDSYTGKITNVTSVRTVTPTVANKLSVAAKTNKTARGTVTVNKSTAAPGEIVTITVSPKNGELKTLTYSYAGGKTYTRNFTSNKWDEVTATSSAGIPAQFLAKGDIASIGAAIECIVSTGSDSTYTFTVDANPTGAITVNATFDTYSGESTWYYNGYDNSGNALSGYHTKQMTESMVGGEKFSYYHVEGRTGTDQFMTVSDGVPSSGTRYVYFVRPTDWGNGWSASNNPRAHFWNDSADQTTWPGNEMTWAWNNDYGQGVYKTAIPADAKYVKFNDNNGKQTVTIDLTTTGGAYYLAGGGSGTESDGYKIAEWNTGWADQGWVDSGTEYFYQNSTHNGDYTGDFNTKGFYNHNTASKEFAKPMDLGNNEGNYYINVLYPNTTYTINGVTKKTGTNPMIIWSAEPLAGDDETVTVYAKDGSIRSEANGSTYANIADTKIYLNNDTVGTKHSGNITNQTWETYKAAKGDTLVIKTQIGATDSSTLSNADDLKAKYYVRGFCVNGEVSELLEWNADGLYTLTYKIPEDTEITKFEITPIYYLKDTTANPIVTYRVTGFTDELKAVGTGKPGWGDTLYTYPYYGKLGGDSNAFGAYPGQPMVYYKGQYQMQIPQKSTTWVNNTSSNTTVSGVTMSNGYWDSVHKSIMGYGNNSTSADHVQTYDYGDFYKIFNEKKPVDNIVFDFKYRTKKHNFENQPAASTTKSALDSAYGDTNGNGFELLTNFHGRTVDLFGTPLSGSQLEDTPVYVVSIGGVNGSAGVENIAGYYATEWMVYGSSDGSSYSRISANGKNSIPPEVLVLNDDDDTSFNTTTYPSADATHNVTDWKALYTALEAYRGKPVMISYEAADAQIGAGNYNTSGGGGATRNDGRWLYSKNGENITSTIKIQYSENGTDYIDYTESSTVTGLEAYFTNADAYKKQTYATTIDPDKTFDFEAKTTNSDYMFVGWYMADGTKITSDNASHTERSGSYTFVAKFKKVTEGQLVLSHSVATGKTMLIGGAEYTLDGSGTAKIGAVVKDHESGEILSTFETGTSDIILDKKYIGSEKDYDVEVTLVAKADDNTALGTTELVEDSTKGVTNDPFFNNPSLDETVSKQRTYTFSFNVKSDLYGNTTTQKTTSLIYHSYFIQYKFNYTLNYEYKDRNGADKQIKRIGTLTSAEANTYIEKRNDTRYLLASFIEKMAPYESNFGQDITWNFEDVAYGNGSNYTYTLDHHFIANQTELNKRNITFALPYQHNNGVAVMTTDGIGTKATTTNLELIAVTDKDGKITQDNRVDFNTIPVLPSNGENGIFTEEGKKNWIAAPATITDGSATYNFQYWSVKPTDRSGENDPDVARCYFQGFNFVAYDNYIITPVYGESAVEPSEIGCNTNITYVETTRNQWNTNGTDYSKTQTSYAADLLYNDFIIAYNYDGKDIYNGEANDDIAELGVVVERIKKLEIKDDGSYDTTLSRYSNIAPNDEGVNAAIASATDIKLSGKNSISKHAITPSSLDNKNRIQFYNGIYNSAGWVQNDEGGAPAQNYGYKNYVYRAYSYMKLKNGTVIKSAVPAYFTMYDVATADLNNSN